MNSEGKAIFVDGFNLLAQFINWSLFRHIFFILFLDFFLYSSKYPMADISSQLFAIC